MTHPGTPRLGTRNATLEDLAALLQDQQARKVDVVAAASVIHADRGRLIIAADPQLTPDGVTLTAGAYTPTEVCDQGLADKLGIPGAYLRRLRAEHPALYDANLNGWLERSDKRYLIRGLRGDGGGGVARAFLSDGYKIIDNLDVLMAALDGIRQAGTPVTIQGCDLTDRRMYVRVISDTVSALAPQLLADYRSPFTGAAGADNPIVFGGFVIANSETGCGAFTLTPRLVIQVCDNGMTITRDALRAIHLGGRMDEGVIRWSHDTQQRNLQLVTAQARDAVTTFLDTGYVQAKITEITRAAGVPVADPENAINVVANKLRFTDDQQRNILAHFIRGADLSAGGVLHAMTSVAQTIDDADTAHDMEAHALDAMEIAARA
jgi:hypothetical protein